MGKITVKHYLNKRLKPKKINGILTFLVYISANYAGTDHQIRSQWFRERISEHEFLNDESINKLLEYEKEIVNEIILMNNENDTHNLSDYLGNSLSFIRDWFFTSYLKDNIERDLLEFIKLKTGLSEKLIEINLGYFNYHLWTESIQKNIFDTETKTKALIFVQLLEYEKENFTLEYKNIYKPNEILNFYEWFKRGAKERFIEYAKSKKIVSNVKLKEVMQTFDNDIITFALTDFPF